MSNEGGSEMSGRLLTVDEAAKLAQVSKATMLRWIAKGAVRAVRPSPVARRRLIPAEDVDPRRHLKP
jgi:hypothetical protein